MPLTKFQRTVSALLSKNRTKDSFLAGGAALHFQPNSSRYSNDLDFFHDSVERVATAFATDRKTLEEAGISVAIEIQQPGYIRAVASSKRDETKIEWAHDSAWRFFPAVYQPQLGLTLHPIDIALNKVLALSGRDEARDFIDIIEIHEKILSLGALCWAAVGKDPGFNPHSLLALLKRRGRYREEDFRMLMLVRPISLVEMKEVWLEAIESAESFFTIAGSETGCLFYNLAQKKFVQPLDLSDPEIKKHFGTPGGIIPSFYDGDPLVEKIGAYF